MAQVVSLADAVKQITPLLPVPMDPSLLVSSLATSLNIKIEVTGAPFSEGSTTGALIKDSAGDLIIVFDEGADPTHQLHIVLHEIGHLLLGHRLITVSTDDVQNLMTHPLSCPHPAAQEDAAEQFATTVVAIVSALFVKSSETRVLSLFG